MYVTNPNPEHDPADIRGAARPDPGAEDTTDDSVQGTYPTHDDGRDRANTCATCWQQIPDGRIKCPHCATNRVREPSNGDDTAVLDWSFGRVVVAVVPGNSTYHARALGASAFTVSDQVATGPDVSHGEVKLRAAFETAPASHLTDGWPALPTEAPIEQPAGAELFETAVEHTAWDGDSEPQIYREDGQPVDTQAALESLHDEIEAADEQYWVVPGIVQRFEAIPDLDDIEEPLYCVGCQAITGHEAVGCDSIASHPHRGRHIWKCQSCGHPRHEPADREFEGETLSHFDLPFEGPPAASLREPDIRD